MNAVISEAAPAKSTAGDSRPSVTSSIGASHRAGRFDPLVPIGDCSSVGSAPHTLAHRMTTSGSSINGVRKDWLGGTSIRAGIVGGGKVGSLLAECMIDKEGVRT